LDSYEHHQLAFGARLSHGSLDRERNDRVGRVQRQLFEHRREILRAIWFTDAYSNTNCNSDTKSHTDFASSAHPGAAPYAVRVGYRYL